MRNWLIKLRKNKELTQEYVASRAFIDRAYYTQIENGNRNPSINVAKRIAEILNFSPSFFFTEHCEPFYLALTKSPVFIAHCDLELRYTWVFNPYGDECHHMLGLRDDEFMQIGGMNELMKIKQEVIKKGTKIRRMITFTFENKCLTYDVFAQPLTNDTGELIGVTTTSTDLSYYIEKHLVTLKTDEDEAGGGLLELYT